MRTNKGFSLVELLVVIAIVGLLAALVSPVLRHFKAGDNNAAADNMVVQVLRDARQQAIVHRSQVYVLFGTNQLALWTTRNFDQPGVVNPTLLRSYTLPDGEFIATWKFYPSVYTNTVGGVPVRGFDRVFGFPSFTNENAIPFVLFNWDGSLTNTVDIPLSSGTTLIRTNTLVSVTEEPAGISTNGWRLVHVDPQTGVTTLNEREPQ